MYDITTRLAQVAAIWPAAMQNDLRRYMRLWKDRPETAGEAAADSYWLLLPQWLAEKINGGRKRRAASDAFVNDILFGQYCLFLAVRIQDDLYDRHARRQSLIFITDQLLLEAGRIFIRHHRRSPGFWPLYHGCLEATTQGIVVADGLQKSMMADPRILLREYARVSSEFKIGSASICIRWNRTADWPAIAAACDRLAMATQIIDDLQDIMEDLHRGRINYAAQVLAGGSYSSDASLERLPGIIAENMAYSDGLSTLMSEIDKNLRWARRLLRPLGIPAAETYIGEMRDSIMTMRKALHIKRVQFVFDGYDAAK